MSTPAPTCRWCDRPGGWLCDAVVRTATVRGRAVPVTCDAPMCAGHRTRVGGGIACTRGSGGGGVPFSVDHCPDPARTPAAA